VVATGGEGAFGSSPDIGKSVVHLIPTAIGRGAQVFARSLVDELGGPDAGHLLVSMFTGPTDVPVDMALDIPDGGDPGLNVGALRRVASNLRRFHSTVVVAHGGDAFKYAALSPYRCQLVYCVIGMWPYDSARRMQRMAWRALVRRARVLVPVSDDVARDCHEVLDVRLDRMVVIPNGRDHGTFHPTRSRPQDAAGVVTLLFVGHLDRGKRPDAFIDLVETMRTEGLPVRGVMVGDGELRSELSVRAARAGVNLVGWQSDVVAFLQSADILVMTSQSEGMPGVLIEAGLCGLPTVTTRVSGASTVVHDGVTGRIVPIDEPEALLRATRSLVLDPELRRTMGEAARAHCVSRFSLSQVAASWDRLLRSLATGGGTPLQ
jgi:glycosyltransferase involved in cell wall biosynthesis